MDIHGSFDILDTSITGKHISSFAPSSPSATSCLAKFYLCLIIDDLLQSRHKQTSFCQQDCQAVVRVSLSLSLCQSTFSIFQRELEGK